MNQPSETAINIIYQKVLQSDKGVEIYNQIQTLVNNIPSQDFNQIAQEMEKHQYINEQLSSLISDIIETEKLFEISPIPDFVRKGYISVINFNTNNSK